MTEERSNQLNVEVQFDSWDGDGTVTLTNESGSITLDVEQAEEQLREALETIRQKRGDLAWNR